MAFSDDGIEELKELIALHKAHPDLLKSSDRSDQLGIRKLVREYCSACDGVGRDRLQRPTRADPNSHGRCLPIMLNDRMYGEAQGNADPQPTGDRSAEDTHRMHTNWQCG